MINNELSSKKTPLEIPENINENEEKEEIIAYEEKNQPLEEEEKIRLKDKGGYVING